MKKAILLFGANGQLGTDIYTILNSLYNVIAINRNIVDISNTQAVDHFLQQQNSLAKEKKIYAIINCVALTNVDGNEHNIDLAFRLNTSFPAQLVHFCKVHNILLVHFSTDYIFDGKTKNYKYTEQDIANPLNIYGVSKYSADTIIKNYLQKYFIFRVSSLFGTNHATGKQGSGFIPTMLKLAKERDSWNVISDQISCPTHTLDVARVVLYFLQHNINDYGIFNCVSNNHCAWYTFAQLILTEYGYDATKIKPINYSDYKFVAHRPQYSILDISKISKYYLMPSYEQAFLEYKKINLSH